MTEHIFNTVGDGEPEHIAITVAVPNEDGTTTEVRVAATGWDEPAQALKAFYQAGQRDTLLDLAASIDASINERAERSDG